MKVNYFDLEKCENTKEKKKKKTFKRQTQTGKIMSPVRIKVSLKILETFSTTCRGTDSSLKNPV